jgi:hypothetical protein
VGWVVLRLTPTAQAIQSPAEVRCHATATLMSMPNAKSYFRAG